MSNHLKLFVVLLLLTTAACSSSDSGSDPTTTTEAPAPEVTTTTVAPTTTTTTKAPTTTTTDAPAATDVRFALEWTNSVDGKFVATGGAVDAGAVCADGRSKFSSDVLIEEEPGEWEDWESEYELTCADDSGTFMLGTVVHIVLGITPEKATGDWELVSEAGAYEDLTGGGAVAGACDTFGCVYEMEGIATTAPATTATDAAAWPAEIAYHQMAYDAGSDVVLLIGGLGPNFEPIADLRSLDPREMTWSELEDLPEGLDPAGVPVAYDSESDRVIYMQTAGFDPEDDPVSTWAYDTDAATWTEMTPDPHPRLGFGARMAYDGESDRIITYGGMAFQGEELVVTPGTWAYDYNTNTWEELDPGTEPPRVNYHGMAYDSESDRTIVFGLNDLDMVSLLWAFDYNTTTWEELPLAGGPDVAFAYTRAAYDPASDRVLVLGGLRMVDGELAAHEELWSYDYNTNTWEARASLDHPLVHHDMVFVDSTGEVVVFGGGVGNGDAEFQGNGLWAYDPAADTWTSVGP